MARGLAFMELGTVNVQVEPGLHRHLHVHTRAGLPLSEPAVQYPEPTSGSRSLLTNSSPTQAWPGQLLRNGAQKEWGQALHVPFWACSRPVHADDHAEEAQVQDQRGLRWSRAGVLAG